MNIKIKFTAAALASFLAFSSLALAEGDRRGGDEKDHGARFAEHKADMIANINEEKSLLDQVASCVKSAKDKAGLEKCHNIKRDGMDRIKAKMLQKRKAHLQDQIKKIDAKEGGLRK